MSGPKTLGAILALALLAAVVAAVPASGGSSDGTKATYIVQLIQAPVAGYEGGVAGFEATKPQKGKKLDASSPAAKQYANHLESKHDAVLDKVGGGDKIYDYTTVFNGFAAQLTEEQAAKLEASKDVVNVEKEETLTLDTSSTPAFLGLDAKGGLWDQLGGSGKGGVGSGAGEDVVIGDVDGGYWPENPAFSDRKVGGGNGNLYPHKVTGFSGICQAGEDFPASTCNGKVIGARYFAKGVGEANVPDYEYLSPRDWGGHGTHTASTMAGNYGVQATGDAASFGKLSGIAPRARLAVYKACYVLPGSPSGSCNSVDTTAAIDQAVEDGVDAINYSISGTTSNFTNSVEVSFLFAAAAGVYVSASAGNSGPTAATVAHPSPWVTTTAAGTHNRDGKGTVTINGKTYNGATASAAPITGTLIDSTAAALPGADANLVALCYSDSDDSADVEKPVLDPAKIAGKIVVCDRGGNGRTDKSLAVKEAGGIGMILVNTSPNSINADLHLVPTIHLSGDCVTSGDPAVTTCPQRDEIKAAAAAGKTAAISNGTIVYDAAAPFTASFSSRGPINAGGGDILKPDIMAPGQDILAAVAPPGNHGRDFDLYSGTSMSSPHMTALGALMHQAHPDWSPMMIKSALMTTATQSNDYDAFRWGAGHVDPNKAPDPGLVFDSNLNDWFAFLKGQKLCCATTASIPALDASDLNQASIAIGDLAGSQTVSRSATSVGSSSETYTFSTVGLPGLTVTPSVTSFTAAPGSVTPWTVTFLRTTAPLDTYSKGFIVWTGDKGHVVKMPVAIKPVKFQAPTEVQGSGTDSSVTYDTKSGFNGDVTYSVRGLEAATKFVNTINGDPDCDFDTDHPDAMVAEGHTSVSSFTTPTGASYIRFQTFIADSDAASKDLDMFVYRFNPDPAVNAWQLIGSSGGGDSNEVVNTTSAASLTAGAQFKVYVHGCGVGPGPGTFTLFAWAVRTPASNPFATTPASPKAVTIGQVVPTTFSWTGLPAGNRYLGRVQYRDETVVAPASPVMASTVIAVSTR